MSSAGLGPGGRRGRRRRKEGLEEGREAQLLLRRDGDNSGPRVDEDAHEGDEMRRKALCDELEKIDREAKATSEGDDHLPHLQQGDGGRGDQQEVIDEALQMAQGVDRGREEGLKQEGQVLPRGW